MKLIPDDAVIEDIHIENANDYPDFADAFIASATINGRDATSQELDELNEDSSHVHELAMEKYF